MNNKISLLITTINIPTFIVDIAKQAIRNKIHFDCIIIGDKKTNKGIYSFIQSLKKYENIKVDYYDVKRQIKVFKRFKKFYKIMPYNSGVRKMFANLIATTRSYDQNIMIDDDNFIHKDFFNYHMLVGKTKSIKQIKTKSKYFNIYESLKEQNNLKFYPRGFPWSERFKKNKYKISKKVVTIDLINGLVLKDPDIDAISRLFWPINVKGVKNKFLPIFGLNRSSWTSFNNQNTSISKNVTDIYFTPPSTGRNSDIWTSYFIYKILDHMNTYICFGRPIVKQIRNIHNLWEDLNDELKNNINTDNFVNLLRSITLSKKNYFSVTEELIIKGLKKLKNSNIDQDNMIKKFFLEYMVWIETVKKLKKQKILL